MNFTKLLRHGVTAGAAAGVSAALVLWLVVEPVIRRALVIEEARGGGHHDHGEEPLVSRAWQLVGGLVTSALAGIMFGVVFAVVFAKIRHRLPGTTHFGRALVLAATGFTVFTLMPALKIPANPPAVGDPATVNERTRIYLLTIVAALLVAGIVFALDGLLRGRHVAVPLRGAAISVVALVGAAAILLLVPNSPDVVPGDVPVALMWDFRLASLAQLGAMWLVLGLGFGLLAEPRPNYVRGGVPVPV